MPPPLHPRSLDASFVPTSSDDWEDAAKYFDARGDDTGAKICRNYAKDALARGTEGEVTPAFWQDFIAGAQGRIEATNAAVVDMTIG